MTNQHPRAPAHSSQVSVLKNSSSVRFEFDAREIQRLKQASAVL